MELAPMTSAIHPACSSVFPSPLQNKLLAALSPEVQKRLFPSLEQSPLPRGKVIHKNGEVLSHAYFPTDAIISKAYYLEDGASTEFSVVGKDGFIGIGLVMGGISTPWIATVQRQGNSFRLPAKVLQDEFNRHGELMSVMLRYAQTLLTQMAQTAVCNRHHTVKQQLCRWLLQCLDLTSDTRLDMTQELIASMLGVRREGVTEAAGKLRKLGVITYSRGHINVLDRERLEQLSCECYGVVRSEKERVMNCGSRSARHR